MADDLEGALDELDRRLRALQAELDELRAEDRALARDEHRRRT